METTEFVLQLTGICKRFGMAEVLSNVNFDLKKGEIHALVGENGAGKSTLMNVIYGLVSRDKGDICVKGKTYKHVSTSLIKSLGVALVPQKLQVLSNLSVAENIFINNWPGNERLGFVSWKKMQVLAKELLSRVNLAIDPGLKMGDLSYVDQQMVVITRMLFAENADIILLDEPTAPLVEQEINLLFDFIRSLKEQGYSFIYISHYLHEVFQIADRATALRDGKVVFTRNVNTLTMGELITGMVGEDVELFPKRESHLGDVVLEVRNLVVPPLVNGLDLSLREGEILGIAGIKGSGKTETARAICGLDGFAAGEILLRGRELKISNVNDALSVKMGYLSEDRIKWGLVGVRSLAENTTITFLKKIASRLGIIKLKDELQEVRKVIKTYEIRTTGPNQSCKNLSGGNQQKVVFAKLIGADLNVLFLDEPTFGVDVKAKTHIYNIMNDFVAQGNSIVLISSDIYEMVAMCDRILFMRLGKIAESFDRGKISEKQLQEVLAHDSH